MVVINIGALLRNINISADNDILSDRKAVVNRPAEDVTSLKKRSDRAKKINVVKLIDGAEEVGFEPT